MASRMRVIGVLNGEMNGAVVDGMMARHSVNVVNITRESARVWQPSPRIERQHWQRQRNYDRDRENVREEIEVVNGRGVPRWLQSRPDQTLIETETIETGEIGNAPIGRGRVVIDPIASGNPALLGQKCRAIATATIETGEIGNARIGGIPVVTDRTAPGSPTPPDRQ